MARVLRISTSSACSLSAGTVKGITRPSRRTGGCTDTSTATSGLSGTMARASCTCARFRRMAVSATSFIAVPLMGLGLVHGPVECLDRHGEHHLAGLGLVLDLQHPQA